MYTYCGVWFQVANIYYFYNAFGKNNYFDDTYEVNKWGYCDQLYDWETNNYYMRARYYNPETGRFISEDTHWNPSNMIYGDRTFEEDETKYPDITASLQAGNLYAYCMGNPNKYIDTYGESAWETLGWPGEIHNVVRDVVAEEYTLLKEQSINNPGGLFPLRADLFDPMSGEIWDVKPVGCNREAARNQVLKYVENGLYFKNKDIKSIDLKVGGGKIAPGEIYYNSGLYQYHIQYWLELGGLIVYKFDEVFDWDKAMEIAAITGAAVVSAAVTVASGGTLVPAF
ncbi:MAG: RHS repeat-associated core domain-containing protein [Clostridia bacterium]|nr:RHS repeat-associated core domain-containing protein [Clostridia bacterium]